MKKRVKDVECFWNEGILNPESNVQFGEGGAGTFSDGKLTTGIKDPRIRKVLEEFVRAGADEDILYKQKPHIGTDVLRTVVKNIREEIIRCGGEVRFDTRCAEVNTKKKCVKSVVAECEGQRYEIPTQNVILAVGAQRPRYLPLSLRAGESKCSRNPFLSVCGLSIPRN